MQTIISSEIIEISDVRDGSQKVIFKHIAEDGTILGPYVEHRPITDDINQFIASHRESLNAQAE